MPHKQIKYKPIGMNRDLSISAANPKYAYTINNMRIINNEETAYDNRANLVLHKKLGEVFKNITE